MSAVMAGACRIAIGTVFIIAFWAQHRTSSARRLESLDGYRIVPRAMQPWTLALLSVAEAVLGLTLALGLWSPFSQLAAALLLLVFAGAMAQALGRGLVTECGCFGSLSSSRVRPALIARNLVLVGLLLWSALATPALVFQARIDLFTTVVLTVTGVIVLVTDRMRLADPSSGGGPSPAERSGAGDAPHRASAAGTP